MIHCHPFFTDIGEQVVAVGAAPILVTADACYGTTSHPGRHVQVDGWLIRGYLERDHARVEPQASICLDEVPAGIDLKRQTDAYTPLASSNRWSVRVMPCRLARWYTKNGVWVG